MTNLFSFQQLLKTAGLLAAAIAIGFVSPRLPLFGVIAFALFIVLGAWILKQPAIGVVLIALVLPLERVGALEMGGLTVRLSQLFGGVVIVALVWSALKSGRVRLRPNPLFWPAMFFLAVNALSLLNAENPDRGITVLLFLALTILVSWAVTQALQTETDLHRVIKALLVGFILVSAFGLFQFAGDLAGLPTSITGLRPHYTKEVFGFPRIQSTALEPLYFANYLLLPLGLLFSFFWSKARTLKIGWVVLLLVLAGLNFGLTISRGGYIAGGAMVVTISLFYLREWLDVKKILLGVLLVGLTGVGFVRFLGEDEHWETFVEHTQNLFYGASFSERIENYEKAWVAFQEHPIIGIGIGGFGPRLATTPYLQPVEGWKIVNNEPLEILAESGLIGLFFFLMLIVMLIARSLKAIWHSPPSFWNAVMIGLFGALVGVLVQYQTFSVLYIMHIWFLFGLMVAVQNKLLAPSS